MSELVVKLGELILTLNQKQALELAKYLEDRGFGKGSLVPRPSNPPALGVSNAIEVVSWAPTKTLT